MVYNKFSTFQSAQELNRFMMGMDKRKTLKVFDEEKAMKIIKEHDIKKAYGGLAEDWSCTSDLIYTKGDDKVDIRGVYTSSVWATPIVLDANTGIEYECYKIVKRED